MSGGDLPWGERCSGGLSWGSFCQEGPRDQLRKGLGDRLRARNVISKEVRVLDIFDSDRNLNLRNNPLQARERG